MDTETLLKLLQRESRPEHDDHTRRQQLLLSNVAGFD